MRSWRHELVSSVISLSIPIGAVAVFPYGSVGFVAKPSLPSSTSSSGCAFVRLTAEAEDAAVRSTAATWRMERDDRVGDRFNLRELPEEVGPARLSGLAVELPIEHSSTAEFALPAWRPSVAAPPPSHLKAKVVEPLPEFSREELLKLN